MGSVKHVKWHLWLAVLVHSLVAFSTATSGFVGALRVQCCTFNWARHGTSASHCVTMEIDGGVRCIPILHTTLPWETM